MCEPVPDDQIDPVPVSDEPATPASDTGNGEPPPN